MKKLWIGAAVVGVATLAFGGVASAAPRGVETLTMTVNVASPNGPSPATAAGVFNGTGTDTRTSRVKRRVDRAKDVLTFSTGTVTLRDVGVRRTKLDATTCTRTLTERGVWVITHGTGAFKHARGHGKYKATGTIQGVQGTSGCDFSAPTGSITVTAKGKVN